MSIELSDLNKIILQKLLKTRIVSDDKNTGLCGDLTMVFYAGKQTRADEHSTVFAKKGADSGIRDNDRLGFALVAEKTIGFVADNASR